jgi:hypothetical protein
VLILQRGALLRISSETTQCIIVDEQQSAHAHAHANTDADNVGVSDFVPTHTAANDTDALLARQQHAYDDNLATCFTTNMLNW